MNTEALSIAGLYAGLSMLILFWLANETGKLRRANRILFGDGGNRDLARLMRGSANCAEYMPMFLIMLLIAALGGTASWMLHGLGLTFTAGRALHAWYFVQSRAPIWQRLAGFGASAAAVAGLMLWLIVNGVMTLFS